MCEDMRSEIRRLMQELGISQAHIVRTLKKTQKYSASTSEFSNAMNGLNTPKSCRMLTDALSYLVEERMKRKALVEIAKRN